ncbi:hypothetical protein [Candidatus Magnetomonas plexicatena]|uniref:hypothetical protein n=1 Tax=Candidatus Magnetomonas plexicatena TaxID=2552947 RepID=UPI001C7415F8|nr:hypothetical protein E2O03_005585 [Nitrospirales bacterium LBB_01]
MLRALYVVLILFVIAAPVYGAGAYTPVYVNIVVHNEEPDDSHPDYLNNPLYYYNNRAALREFALMIKSNGAVLNLQADWNYLLAVAYYDVGDVVSDTNGKNIVRWLVEDLGFEVDPHTHETVYNYADVAYLISQLGVTPSRNVGGFMYYPPETGSWEKHTFGIYGLQFPLYFWQADNLWGAATYEHGLMDDTSFGVWKPKTGYGFYEHDPSQRLLYIGGGCGSMYGIADLINVKDNGVLNPSGFYTASIFVPQKMLDPLVISTVSDYILTLEPYVSVGKVQWMTLTQIADIWRLNYANTPSQVVCNKVPDGMPLDNSTERCPIQSCSYVDQIQKNY